MVPINHFNRAKPFYPLVMNYLLQLVGFEQIAVRGLVEKRDIDDGVEKVIDTISTAYTWHQRDPQAVAEVRRVLNKLVGPLQLKSEFQGNHIKIDFDAVAKELIENFDYLTPFLLRSAGSLIVLAHEMCKDKPYHDQGPLWEFLRHCRNAAAHGGSFAFHKNEPRWPAEWGPFRLTASFQGTPLFKGKNEIGLLSPGDPIRLLWDIEQAYSNMIL